MLPSRPAMAKLVTATAPHGHDDLRRAHNYPSGSVSAVEQSVHRIDHYKRPHSSGSDYLSGGLPGLAGLSQSVPAAAQSAKRLHVSPFQRAFGRKQSRSQHPFVQYSQSTPSFITSHGHRKSTGSTSGASAPSGPASTPSGSVSQRPDIAPASDPGVASSSTSRHAAALDMLRRGIPATSRPSSRERPSSARLSAQPSQLSARHHAASPARVLLADNGGTKIRRKRPASCPIITSVDPPPSQPALRPASSLQREDSQLTLPSTAVSTNPPASAHLPAISMPTFPKIERPEYQAGLDTDESYSFAQFLRDYEYATSANGWTDFQRVERIRWYVTGDIREHVDVLLLCHLQSQSQTQQRPSDRNMAKSALEGRATPAPSPTLPSWPALRDTLLQEHSPGPFSLIVSQFPSQHGHETLRSYRRRFRSMILSLRDWPGEDVYVRSFLLGLRGEVRSKLPAKIDNIDMLDRVVNEFVEERRSAVSPSVKETRYLGVAPEKATDPGMALALAGRESSLQRDKAPSQSLSPATASVMRSDSRLSSPRHGRVRSRSLFSARSLTRKASKSSAPMSSPRPVDDASTDLLLPSGAVVTRKDVMDVPSASDSGAKGASRRSMGALNELTNAALVSYTQTPGTGSQPSPNVGQQAYRTLTQRSALPSEREDQTSAAAPSSSVATDARDASGLTDRKSSRRESTPRMDKRKFVMGVVRSLRDTIRHRIDNTSRAPGQAQEQPEDVSEPYESEPLNTELQRPSSSPLISTRTPNPLGLQNVEGEEQAARPQTADAPAREADLPRVTNSESLQTLVEDRPCATLPTRDRAESEPLMEDVRPALTPTGSLDRLRTRPRLSEEVPTQFARMSVDTGREACSSQQRPSSTSAIRPFSAQQYDAVVPSWSFNHRMQRYHPQTSHELSRTLPSLAEEEGTPSPGSGLGGKRVGESPRLAKQGSPSKAARSHASEPLPSGVGAAGGSMAAPTPAPFPEAGQTQSMPSVMMAGRGAPQRRDSPIPEGAFSFPLPNQPATIPSYRPRTAKSQARPISGRVRRFERHSSAGISDAPQSDPTNPFSINYSAVRGAETAQGGPMVGTIIEALRVPPEQDPSPSKKSEEARSGSSTTASGASGPSQAAVAGRLPG